jgi:phage anti-repressor protein
MNEFIITETVNIDRIMTQNPVIKLSGEYQSKLVNKVKENFTTEEQKLFIGSFYCYLKYHPTNDFVIDLNDVWKFLKFSRVDNAKVILFKHFEENKDYVIEKAAPEISGAGLDGKNLGGAGKNKEKTTMNIRTFKKLCMIARTDKAFEIHDYFIKMEELLHETMEEESNELRQELLLKNRELDLEKTRLKNVTKKKVFGKPKNKFVYVYKSGN